MTTFTPRPASLGRPCDIALGPTTLRYFESGDPDGQVVVLVHGLLTNADLWRDVAPGLAAAGLRCLAVDWPLGSHQIPVPDADLTPPGVADLIAEFLQALDLHEVTVVGNDTGGALTQILMTRHPERIGRVVLTSCDSFERFLPPLFNYLPKVAKIPGVLRMLSHTLRPTWAQRTPLGFGWLAKYPMPATAVDSFLVPSRRSQPIRHDLTRFVTAIHRRHTLAAAEMLPQFDRPVLLAWSAEDKHFPVSLAERLLALLPDARLSPIEDSYTWVPEDQPAALVDLIADFVQGADAA